MSTRTTARLPASPPPREVRRREIRMGLLAWTGLVAVLAGIPAALVVGVGNPLPTTAPSADWLTADVSATLVLKVLACAVWVAWAHFLVCVLSEWRALRRGRMPSDVPFGGGSQAVARRLVATALLLAGAATLAPGAVAPVPERPAAISIVAQQQAPEAPVEAAPAVQAVAASDKTYTVQPPEGRRYDCLWDIAERTLGDPLRWKEIFALNTDRVQADGARLIDADLIRPGWVLTMPVDAVGEGVATREAAPLPAAQAAPEPVPASGGVAAAQSASPAAEQSASPAPAQSASPAAEQDRTARTALGAGLLAAGLLAAVTARRGPYGAPGESQAEQGLRRSADPGRAALLDRGLRRLAADCAAAGTVLPEVALASIHDDRLVLSLAAPADPPAGAWTTGEDRRLWTLDARSLDRTTLDVPAPYPALAGVGRLPGGDDVLVDLEGATGLVSVSGQGARDCVASMAVELATNSWSDGVLVTLVGFGDDLTEVAPDRVSAVAQLADVLVALEAEAGLGAQRGAGVLAGRLARSATRRPPRVVVLSGAPAPQDAERLRVLVAGGRTPLAVVVVGDVPAASWRFQIGTDGRLDLGVLGTTVEPFRLPVEQYAPVVALLRAAEGERREGAASSAALTPRAAAELAWSTAPGASPEGSPDPAGPGALPARHPDTAPVAVRLLGPVEVTAPGPVDPASLPLLTELVVAAALHRDGLHEAVLRAEVWPRGVGDDVLAATVSQVQAWLGADADGPRLRRAPDGRFTLSADVACDWDVLRGTAATAAASFDEQTALITALALVRGAAFSSTPAGRYGWLAFHRSARDARVVGTAAARRASALALARGDAFAAGELLHAGLALVPTAEPLWRDLLRLTAEHDPSAVAQVVQSSRRALAQAGLRPEPETDALIAQLAPGSREQGAG